MLAVSVPVKSHSHEVSLLPDHAVDGNLDVRYSVICDEKLTAH